MRKGINEVLWANIISCIPSGEIVLTHWDSCWSNKALSSSNIGNGGWTSMEMQKLDEPCPYPTLVHQ